MKKIVYVDPSKKLKGRQGKIMSEEKTKKFCPKCGAELDGDAEFCTKCGASLNRDASSQQVTPDNQEKTNKSGKKEKKKGSKKTRIIIAVIVVVVILVIAMSGGNGDSDDSSIDANALIEEVQNGYLGNYDAVAVKDVFEYEYGTDGDWTGGTPENDDSDWYFLVQYEVEDEITIQFQIYEEDDTEFHVTYLAIGDPEYVYETAYDIKDFLDMCYEDYVSAYPNCGVVIDESTDNNTVVGHFASTKTVSENSENTETDEDTENTGAFSDGVSDDYTEYSCMMDTDTVIEYFHELGYEYVWLESHEVGVPDNGVIGDIGTTDTIYALVTTVGGDDVYHITEEIGILYVYWGDESGWLTSLSTGVLAESDFTGFNGTYWKYTGYNDSEKDMEERIKLAYQILGDEIDYDSLQESISIELYLKLENFDDAYGYIESVTDFSRVYIHHENFGMIFGTAMLVIDGNIYAKNLQIGSNDSVVKIGDYIILCFSGDDFDEKVGVEFNFNEEEVEGTVIQISEEEYLSASEGVASSSSETPTTTHEENNATVEDVDIYGSYYWYNDSDGCEIYADVSWATDDDDGESPYMSISAVDDSSGYYTVLIGGFLVNVSGNTYTVEDDRDICSWTVTFYEDSMEISVDSVSSDDYMVIEGIYEKTGDLDLSDVG